jgi:uncharacterized membrane protein
MKKIIKARSKGTAYLGLAIASIVVLSLLFFSQIVSAFGGFGPSTNATWYNDSWHYRMRIEVNSTAVDRANWTIELPINFTDLVPAGTFDNNSIRVFEYSTAGSLLHEIKSQFDTGDYYNSQTNAYGELVFMLNRTTPANTKRIFYVYYDVIENGAKPAPNYPVGIQYSWNGQAAEVNSTYLKIRIDTNRAENTSGIFYVENRRFAMPIITASAGQRTAEYLEYYNGTTNTTFDLVGNLSFTAGPVRLTIRQEGPEVVFGNAAQKTGLGRIVKKYYIYNNSGPEQYGAFIKISQEFFSNSTPIVRSSPNAGAPAFDVKRTFLGQNIQQQGQSLSDPYSWAWATSTAGSMLGIINANETEANYSASNSTDLGRVGIGLSSTTIPAGLSIRQTSLVYFSIEGSFAVSEFLDIKNGTSYSVIITQSLPEAWTVQITPSINTTIYNRNETVIVRANMTGGDAYNLTKYMNATINLGTPSTADDITIPLYDDGTNNDAVAGDRIFTNNYTINAVAVIGEWTINFSAYGNSTEFLNSTILPFNVTDIYFVNLTIVNPTGIVSRQVFANITVKNYLQTSLIAGANISCVFGSTSVVNKTDNGNGTYAVNFTAPSAVGTFSLFCNATRSGNIGNDTEQFITEPPTTRLIINVTPDNTSAAGITLYNNFTFAIIANSSNNESGIARSANITLELLSGWSANYTVQLCGDVGINSSCMSSFNITVPNNTAPGSYIINATAKWSNLDGTQNTTKAPVNVTVLSNPQLDIQETSISGFGADGTTKNITTFDVFSVGNDQLTDVLFNCTVGAACSDFNISFYPVNITSLNVSNNASVIVAAEIPFEYPIGTYNGTINASSANLSDTATIFITIQNTTYIHVQTSPESKTVSKTIYQNVSFAILTNVTNMGNSSALNVNLSFAMPLDWSINSSFESCGNITKYSICKRDNSVTIPNNATSGNYTVNITSRWGNRDNTTNLSLYVFNVTVSENPVVGVDNNTLYGEISDDQSGNIYNLTVISIGSSSITNITLSCESGTVCANFTPIFIPQNISSIVPGQNSTVKINVSIPVNFTAGLYNGTLNVSAGNDGSEIVMLYVSVIPNIRWEIAPTFCLKSTYPDEGKACDVNVTNTGNGDINFTIVSIAVNNTYPDIINFSVPKGEKYTFSVMYNVTGFVPGIYNSTYMVAAIQDASPQNTTINITLLPYTPPNVTIEVVPTIAEQGSIIEITANVTDNSNTGMNFVTVNVTRPNSTVDTAQMSVVSQSYNLTVWKINYSAAFGNTSLRGLYNISVMASDNVGNIYTNYSNFTIRMKLIITSNTLSQQYYQSDTGTIYYSARNISSMGIQDVNVSFFIYGINSTLIYSTGRITDSLGTFAPLPVFTLASDAPVGNYTLRSISIYNDTVANLVFSVEKNHSFAVNEKTVTVTGLFADIETAVVWFPNNVMRFNMLIYDGEGKTVDPTALNLTVYDAAQNHYFSVTLPSMTKKGTGYYVYNYSMPTSSGTGMYLAVLNVTKSTLSTMKLKAFRVATGGPYDVRLALAKTEVAQGNPLDFTLVIENKGEVTQDVYLNYSVINVGTGTVYYSASEAVLTPAFMNQSFTRSASIFSNQPLGTYMLAVDVKYDNVQPVVHASSTFSVVASGAVVTQPPAAPGGGAGAPVTAQVVTTETPEKFTSIIIEKYNSNVTLSPGFTRLDTVVVRNSGQKELGNITLSVIGIPTAWFNITPKSYTALVVGNSTAFLVEYKIPDDAAFGSYSANLIVTTYSTSDQRSITITILRSVAEIILTEIDKLKADLKDLLIDIGVAKNQGKNVNEVLIITDSIEQNIKDAETNFRKNNTDKAFENIKDAKILIEKARDLLSKLAVPEKQIDLFILVWIFGIVGGTSGALLVLRKKHALPKQMPSHLTHLAKIIHKIKGAGPDHAAMARDREKLTRMLAVLESEKREGIVSDDAYKEMKKSIESKLSRIEKKLEKIVK